MAKNPKFSTGFRNALLNGTDVTNMFDAGELRVYSGTQPADADATEGAGTLLATITVPTPGFAASASAGSIVKSGDWDVAVSVSGTAAWFRLYDSAVTTGASSTAIRIDGSIDLSDGDIVINAIVLTSGDPLSIDTFSIDLNA